jgi:hypothetical protein
MKQSTAVVNRDTAPYTETWKGKVLTIQPGHAIIMQMHDAIDFFGTYSGSDPLDPQRPKVKNLVKIQASDWKGPIDQELATDRQPLEQTYICNYDGQTFPTQEMLNEHLKLHGDVVAKDDSEGKLSDPDGEVKCPFCGAEGLKGHKGLKTHLSQHCKAVKGEIIDDTSTGVLADTVAG